MEQSQPTGEPQVQRRRSTRIVQTVPITVSGTDALGQPFKERTSALVINCHGCKYQSKHYVLKNNWVSLEVAHPEANQAPRQVRGRVVWVQRPRTVQELFQVAVALEVPGNIWGVAFPPEDWFPYPEEAAPSIPSPAPAAPPTAEAPAPPAGKVRMLPPPSGPSPEALAAVERQIAGLIAEAKGQLESTVQAAASNAVTAEAAKLLREVETQLRSAARKSVEAVAAQYLDETVEKALQKIEQSRATSNGAMRERWAADFDSMVGQVSQTLAERFGESEQALREKFRQDLEQVIAQATGQLAESEQRITALREEIAGSAAATQARLQALRGDWEAAAAEAGETWRADADAAQSRVAALRQEIAAADGAAQSQLAALRQEMAAVDSAALSRLEALRAQIDSLSAEATQAWQASLDAQAEATLSHVRAAEETAKKLQEDLGRAGHTHIPQLRADWRQQLESDLARAGETWNALLASALDGAAQRLGRQFLEMADKSNLQARQDAALHMAALRQSFSELAADAQQALLAVRRDLEQDLFRAHGSRQELQAAAGQAAELATRLEALRQTAAEALDQQFQQSLSTHVSEITRLATTQLADLSEKATALAAEMAQAADSHRADITHQSETWAAQIRQRADALFAEIAQKSGAARAELDRAAAEHAAAMAEQSRRHAEEMGRQSEAMLSGMVERLQPIVDAEGRKSVERSLAELDRQLTPRMQTAERLLADLAASQQRVEEALLAHRERLRQLSDEHVSQADRRLKDTREGIQKEWETVSRAQLEKCLGELEEKSTDATHTTFEALYKAAEWYQKKAQTSMQSAMEKATEQATEKLRERAAEISRMFALELDHYSRSYTDHTKALLDESAKEVVGQNREALTQAAQTTAAGFSDEVHRIATEKLRVFGEESSASRDEAMSQLDSHAERVQARWNEFVGRNFTEFQERIAARVAENVDQAQRDFQASLLPILDSWRADREAQHREWLNKLDQASREALEGLTRSTDESLEQYKQRLQNTSNTWMVASVTTLNQHSKTVMETLASAAEARLREACSQALTGMADTLAQQMRAISAQITALPPDATGPEKRK